MNLPAIRNEQQVSRLEVLSIPEPNSGCWLWLGQIKPNGYGAIGMNVDGKWKTKYAHRISYETFVGPIPQNADLDHKCRQRCCVNPDHLEPVSRSENMLRSPLLGRHQSSKTHCPSGHAYSGINAAGARVCRTCQRLAVQKSRSTRS